jgi:Lon protease-like protein
VTHRLPLFPLATVLFPGLLLPLHIFEERYRVLMRELVAVPAGEPPRLGVIAIREGREVGPGSIGGLSALYGVGCTAELRQMRTYDDGRFDVMTSGTSRFRLRALDTSRPYFQGDVEFLDEPPGEGAKVLSAGVSQLFLRYREALLAAQRQPASDPPELPDDAIALSYLVAAAMVLDLGDKQRLLESPDAAARLRAELALLRREAAVVRLLPSVPAVDLVREPMSPN